MNTTLEPLTAPATQATRAIVHDVCRRIPPLWPLSHFVAVNPFVGLGGRHFLEAAALIQRAGHGEMLMPAEYYRAGIAAGRVTEADLQTAVTLAQGTLPPEFAGGLDFSNLGALRDGLEPAVAAKSARRVLTFAEFLDQRHHTGWAAFVVEEMSKWCSAYFDQGQSSWRMPWRNLGLFAAWKAAAQLDANPEWMGVAQFRELVAALPDDHWELLDRAPATLGVPEVLLADFLHRQLMSLPGWSSHVQYLARQTAVAGRGDDPLPQLLAIRLVFDLALRSQFGGEAGMAGAWRRHLRALEDAGTGISRDLLTRYIAQQSLECRYQTELIQKLTTHRAQPTGSGQKALQAVFCIDVRSEVLRRALEAQSEEIETIGFAGFFGMAIEHIKFGQAGGDAHCPVLLSPRFKVRDALADERAEAALLRRVRFGRSLNGAWNAFKTSAISCFSFVETAGLGFGVKLAKDSLALAAPETGFAPGNSRLFPRIEHQTCRPGRHGDGAETGIPAADQLALAAGALKNMGLVGGFAKVVLICGHGSATANNPYGSGLDCGACGGHAGDANARVAAAILNQPAVRQGLRAQGIEIPDATLFIAGLHNTTTDEITIYEDQPPSAAQSAELGRIRSWLSAASRQARRERAASLGLGGVPDGELDEAVFARSRDWSQVRPEWGLAGNAAFIAAPREWTRGLDLGGRTFLHNYHADRDPDKATLELILIAPMVVASWINLQYYASTVDNRLFGSGNKVLHNVVGTFGVWQGNGGDLQPGLPLQSIHDGRRLMHEPVRLSVFLAAPREAIDRVIRSQTSVRELVDNGWVHFFALEGAASHVWRYGGNCRWHPAAPAARPGGSVQP